MFQDAGSRHDSRGNAIHPEALLRAPDWIGRLREVREASRIGAMGRFEVLGEAGRGGQGVVYKALDPVTGGIVAVKRLHPSKLGQRDALARLETEIKATEALSHPGVVRTLGVETDATGLLLVMEWVDGVTLDEWSRPDGARRSAAEVAAVATRIVEVVAHAHARGVIHRDLKPSNILVDAEGRPHVLDFGLARLEIESPAASAASARFVGTLAYAPPELIAHGPEALDARSDLYSLGVTVYEMLAGKPPCDLGRSMASAVQAILGAEPEPLGADRADARLEAILRRTLAKRPEDRYASATELLDDLRGNGRGAPASAAGSSRRVRRRATVAATCAFAFALLFVPGNAPVPATWIERAPSVVGTGGDPTILSLRANAESRFIAGEPELALELVEGAIADLKRSPDAQDALAQAHQVRGEILARLERWPAAEEAYRASITARAGATDDLLPACWSNLATAVLRQGRPREALDHYHRAIAIRCRLLAARHPASRERLEAAASRVERDGLQPDQVAELGSLFQGTVPAVLPLFAHTARRVAEARGVSGDPVLSRRLWESIRSLENATPRPAPTATWVEKPRG